jgi:hypothetical protein
MLHIADTQFICINYENLFVDLGHGRKLDVRPALWMTAYFRYRLRPRE